MRTGLIIALSVCCLLGHVFGQDEQPAQEGNAWLRFTHGYSASGPVDVYVDNLPTASWNWVPFRQVTAYKPIRAGQHTLTLVRANATRMGAEEGQNGKRQEELRPLSDFFSSEDIIFNANFELNEGAFYSLAWFAQQQQEGQQTQEEETGQEEQQNRQEEEQMMMEGLVRETSSWSLYIDRLETAQGQVRFRWIHLVPEFDAISVFFQRAEEENQNRQEEQAIAENLSFPNASNYMTLEAGLYNIIIRRAQQGEEGQQQEGEQQQRQEEEELRRIERVQLLADSVYTGWVLGPLEGQAMEQEMSQIVAIIKFDNFELLRETSGQNSQ